MGTRFLQPEAALVVVEVLQDTILRCPIGHCDLLYDIRDEVLDMHNCVDAGVEVTGVSAMIGHYIGWLRIELARL